jgi:hypothetical protein
VQLLRGSSISAVIEKITNFCAVINSTVGGKEGSRSQSVPEAIEIDLSIPQILDDYIIMSKNRTIARPPQRLAVKSRHISSQLPHTFNLPSVLNLEDVQEIAIESLIIRSGGEERLTSEAEGLKGFLSEKSQQVRDRLHDLIAPEDRPETVRVKIKTVRDELASTNGHDRHALAEATQFLHDQRVVRVPIRPTSHHRQSGLWILRRSIDQPCGCHHLLCR